MIQALVDVFDNILNEDNQEGWSQLQTMSPGSQTLLHSAERYGSYLARAVNNSDDRSVTFVRENISESLPSG